MSHLLRMAIVGATVTFICCSTAALARQAGQETTQQRDERMSWWREARFGMFIHWGLYSIPAGQWKDATQHAEWIRHTARIPVEAAGHSVRGVGGAEADAVTALPERTDGRDVDPDRRSDPAGHGPERTPPESGFGG